MCEPCGCCFLGPLCQRLELCSWCEDGCWLQLLGPLRQRLEFSPWCCDCWPVPRPPSFSPSSSPFSPFSSSPSPSLDKEVGLWAWAKLSLADNLGQNGYGNHICIICCIYICNHICIICIIYICTAIIDVCASENHAKHSKRKVVDVCFFLRNS